MRSAEPEKSAEAGATKGSTFRILQSAMEKLPFFALAALDCFATFWAQRGGQSVVSTAALPLWDRIANALVSYVLYLWKTIWPLNLALPYPYSHEWTFSTAAGAGLLLALITVVAILQARSRPWLIVGWLWFLGMLVPVIGLVQVGLQAMADRYTYVPLIGIFIMVAWSIPGAWARWPRPGLVFGAVTGGVLVFLLAGTETQLQYWRTSATLFSHTAQITRDNILAEYNLGEALAQEGDLDNAIIHYQKALAIRPNRVEAQYNSQPQARYNLGLIYRVQKKWKDAEAQFRDCVRDDPNLARAHGNLGIALAALSRANEALQEFQTSARLNGKPLSDAQLLSTLDVAYGEAGNYSEAILTAQKARDAAIAEKRPDLADAAAKRLEFYRSQTAQHPLNGSASTAVGPKQ
jgi:tetratricopeptide (TPR) repeat protein